MKPLIFYQITVTLKTNKNPLENIWFTQSIPPVIPSVLDESMQSVMHNKNRAH